MLLLRIKGFLRRIKASMEGISPVSAAAGIGIAVIAGLFLVRALLSTSLQGDFQVVEPEHGNAAVEVAGEPDLIFVHVGGAVAGPGVVCVPKGSRVHDCILAAGGFSEDAYADGLNLARLALDGERIIVPSVGDACAGTEVADSGLISINGAGVEELCRLDGIGEVLAKRIVAYRERIGGFTALRQLLEVSGIGKAKFEAIQDGICL